MALARALRRTGKRSLGGATRSLRKNSASQSRLTLCQQRLVPEKSVCICWPFQQGIPYICGRFSEQPQKQGCCKIHYFTENQTIMKYNIDKQEQYAVLTLEEDNLNSVVAPKLKSDFIFFNQEGVRNLIFDLSHVKFVDSSGLSAILTGHRLWKDAGSFVIAGQLNPMVTKLIEISRLDTILTIVPTLSEAVDYVKMEEIERELKAE